MYRILDKKYLTPQIVRMEVEAPRVASAARPGQFLIVRTHGLGERIPLTVCDYDSRRGTVSLVTQAVGASSRRICALECGDAFEDVAGPLGRPSDFTEVLPETLRGQRYLFIAGGLGTAPVYPQVKFLHAAGARTDVIIGARNRDSLIFETEMRAVCDCLYICTEDGSAGETGRVTDVVRRLLAAQEHYDRAVAIGPMVMMKFVTETLRGSGLPLTVSLNTLMVDGTGMCGACRVTVDGRTRFACVEGPEFDAYGVDFDEAIRRQGMYRDQEREADHRCKIGLHQ